MTTEDTTVSFMPYFLIKEPTKFFEVCNGCIEQVKAESLCLAYGFSVSAGKEQNVAFCRQSYLNAQGLMEHLYNIEVLFKEGLCKYGELVSLQIHGPKAELDKLRQETIIQEMCPDFFELMPGSFEVLEMPTQQVKVSDCSSMNKSAAIQSSVNTSPTPTCYMAPPLGYGRDIVVER